MTTTGVEDDCLDGGVGPLFLPEGSGTTSDWVHPIELPLWDAMAAEPTYAIHLEDPFSSMDITMTQGDAERQAIMTAARQTGVEFDETTHPGCTVDMDIDAMLGLQEPTLIVGTSTLTIDRAEGEFCPAFYTPPYTGTTDFRGTRLELRRAITDLRLSVVSGDCVVHLITWTTDVELGHREGLAGSHRNTALERMLDIRGLRRLVAILVQKQNEAGQDFTRVILHFDPRVAVSIGICQHHIGHHRIETHGGRDHHLQGICKDAALRPKRVRTQRNRGTRRIPNRIRRGE